MTSAAVERAGWYPAHAQRYTKNPSFANRHPAKFHQFRAGLVCETRQLRHLCIMAILKLARMGHPVLLARADPVPDPTAPDIRRLLADMIETLEDAGGVGLAAPQVHVPLRLFIYKIPERRVSTVEGDTKIGLNAVINPHLTLLDGELVEDWEGCLSIPGLTALIPRASRLVLTALDAGGTQFTRPAAGFHARVIQHETDHLDGILYPTRMRDMRMIGFNEEIIKFREDILAVHHDTTL
jgi:peptide deformylase